MVEERIPELAFGVASTDTQGRLLVIGLLTGVGSRGRSDRAGHNRAGEHQRDAEREPLMRRSCSTQVIARGRLTSVLDVTKLRHTSPRVDATEASSHCDRPLQSRVRRDAGGVRRAATIACVTPVPAPPAPRRGEHEVVEQNCPGRARDRGPSRTRRRQGGPQPPARRGARALMVVYAPSSKCVRGTSRA